MTVTVDTIATIEPLRDEWDDLATRACAAPFLRPGWFEAWQTGFRREGLEVLVARREGSLIGVMPLHRNRGVTRSATNHHSALFGPLAPDPEASVVLAERVFSRAGHRVSLFLLDPNADSTEALRTAAMESGCRLTEDEAMRSPYIEVNGDFDRYERAMPGRFRSELRRRRRRLEEEGRLRLQVADGTEDLDRLLDEGFRLEGAAWKRSAGTAISSRAETRRFYRELAAWAQREGLLRLAFLRIDGRPIAFDISLETPTTHYLVKTGYDPDFRHAAPGTIIRREMIARAFAEGLRTYEFLGHDEPWKLRWTSASRRRMTLRAFPGSACGRLNWVTATRLRPLAKRAVGRS